MITTKDRTGFAKACFTQGARLRPQIIDHFRDNDIYEIMTYGGIGTWKSLASDAMICGIIDHGSLDMLRDEMMFESVKLKIGEHAQDASEAVLFKFFQLDGKTTCIAFSSSQNFLWNHQRGAELMKDRVLSETGLKPSDLSRMIVFANSANKIIKGHSNTHVKCPNGQENDTRILTFS